MTSTFIINPMDYQDYFIEGNLVKIPRCVVLVAYLLFKRDERFFDLNHLERQFDDAHHYCCIQQLVDYHRSVKFPYGRVKR